MAIDEQREHAPLTAQQIAFYQAFGFVVHRKAYSQAEVNIIERDFEIMMQEDRQGLPFDGRDRQAVGYAHVRNPEVRELTRRLDYAAEQILGVGTLFTEGASILLTGETHWHSDLGWHPSMLGGRSQPPVAHCYRGLCADMYLDRLTCETGCLRVISGSHLLGNPAQDLLAPMHMDIPENFTADGRIEQFDIMPSEVPGYAIESEPGDVILFSHEIWHGSFGGRPGRRLIALSYKASPTTDREREYIQGCMLKKQREAENVT